MYCPDHPTYERLSGGHGSHNSRIAVNESTVIDYRQVCRFSYEDDNTQRLLAVNDAGIRVLPARTDHVDIEVMLHLEYVVVDRAGWYRADVPIRVRILRKQK